MRRLDLYRLLTLFVIGAALMISGLAHLVNENDFRALLLAYLTGGFALLTPFGARIVENVENGVRRPPNDLH